MPTLVTQGDRLVTSSGKPSWLSRPSVPLSMYPGAGSAVQLSGGGAISYQQLYETQHWVAVVVNKLNRQISRLPLKVYRVKPNGERERVRSPHPLVDLLARPYPRASAATLKQKLAFPALVHGNALMVKFRPAAGAAPSNLLPLDWRFITPHTDDAGNLIFWETTQAGDPKRIDPADVVHVAWESGAGDLGVSPLRQLQLTLRTEDAVQRYQSASFDNGARPSGAFVLPEDSKLRKEDRIELREQLERQHAGVDKAFRLALLHGGAKWEAMQQTAVEAELIKQKMLNREEIAAVYDIPPPLIGILDKATYSNIETQHQMLYTDVLGPWLTLIEETLDAQLVAPEPAWADLKLEFDLAQVLRGDRQAEANALGTLIDKGVMAENEARNALNLPRIDDDALDVPRHQADRQQGPQDTASPPKAIISHHLERAADRMRRKGSDGLDLPRFERELAEDLDDPEVAAEWATKVAAAPDARAIRALTPA